LALAGCDAMTDSAMQDIHDKVASDAEEQYRMVEEHGTAIDKCVHAGLVAEAYLQGNNEESYARWKAIERLNCVNAGVPR